HTASLFIGAREIVERCCIRAPRLKRRAHFIDIFSDVIKVQHLNKSLPQKSTKSTKGTNGSERPLDLRYVLYVPFVLFVAYFSSSWLISKWHLGRPVRSHCSWTGALTISATRDSARRQTSG